MKMFVRLCSAVTVIFLLSAPAVLAQPSSIWIRLVETRCSVCHLNPNAAQVSTAERAPDQSTLRQMPPEAIYRALTTGAMRVNAADLSDDLKVGIAEYLGGRKLGSTEIADAKLMPNKCPANPPIGDVSASPAWNGWSPGDSNARFQPAEAAGIAPAQVPQLKLKWAFSFPGATSVYGQPTVVGGRIFMGVDTGYVYSLDAATGCVYWSFQAQSGVRTAISLGPMKVPGQSGYAIYFGDLRANVYALNAGTGELLWKIQVDEHPLAVITGAPLLYQERLYVPVSSREEAAGPSPNYPCCSFRGSMLALDVSTGRQIWKTYPITEAPKPLKKNSKGTQLWGPAGAAIWLTPTIDVSHNALYVATGDSYTEPASINSDAVMALDMTTGKVLWSVQDTKNDAWLRGCSEESTENCPKDLGPDYDFAASPILRTLPNGRRILVVAQKSGEVIAHDPDRKGVEVWRARLVEKLAIGQIVFGGAADSQAAYFGVRDGGLRAVQLTTGELKWSTPLIPKEGQRRGQTAALTAIPGVVFSGGWDGVVRALSTDDGRVLWEYDTVREFTTVNGVAAKGGSMGAPGPTVVGGTLFVGTGYVGLGNGEPGNVLLAFAPQ